MSRWQHFLHALDIHDWHKITEFENEYRDPSHGPHAPVSRAAFVRARCCHCGKEVIVPVWEWVMHYV